METAEDYLKSKLDTKIAIVNNPDYTFNKVIEAMSDFAMQEKQKEAIEFAEWREDCVYYIRDVPPIRQFAFGDNLYYILPSIEDGTDGRYVKDIAELYKLFKERK